MLLPREVGTLRPVRRSEVRLLESELRLNWDDPVAPVRPNKTDHGGRKGRHRWSSDSVSAVVCRPALPPGWFQTQSKVAIPHPVMALRLCRELPCVLALPRASSCYLRSL